MVSSVYFALLALAAPERSKAFEWTSLLAMSLGLALLFKATAAVVLAPYILAFAFLYVRKFRTWSLVPAIASCCIVGIIISSFYTDNWNNFNGKFFAYTVNSARNAVASELYSPGATASAVLRNAAQQLATPFPFFNSTKVNVVSSIHPLTGSATADSRTTVLPAQHPQMPKMKSLAEIEYPVSRKPSANERAGSTLVKLDNPNPAPCFAKTHRLLLQNPNIAIMVPHNSRLEYTQLEPVEKH